MNMNVSNETAAPRLLTKTQLQETLQVGVTTVWEWMNAGMPYYRRGNVLRFDWCQVRDWLASVTEQEKVR